MSDPWRVTEVQAAIRMRAEGVPIREIGWRLPSPTGCHHITREIEALLQRQLLETATAARGIR